MAVEKPTISFTKDEQINFVDNSDYSALTVTRTVLSITYPAIATSTAIEIELYTSRTAVLGDPYDIIIANEVTLSELLDGVYKFVLTAYNGVTSVGSATMYAIQDYEFKKCRKAHIDSLIEKSCPDYCDIGALNVFLDTAKDDAENARWQNAHTIMEYLGEECETLECGCS